MMGPLVICKLSYEKRNSGRVVGNLYLIWLRQSCPLYVQVTDSVGPFWSNEIAKTPSLTLPI